MKGVRGDVAPIQIYKSIIKEWYMAVFNNTADTYTLILILSAGVC
jgi:hypothetical protein